MIRWQTVLQATALALSVPAAGSGGAAAQQPDRASCAGVMTEQSRSFTEDCLSDLATFVASQPEMAAKVYSEKDSSYVTLTRTDDGIRAEAVSKFNHPLMKADTPDILERLGWSAPENESDNWKKDIGSASLGNGGAARELGKALEAYGVKQGEAISLTVGPKLSDQPTSR
ncbi:hypothetical protein IGS68_27810 (plasmid) [Skermanella sp. TT6]|uniref:TY-Chap N-terminal domain-containing protein n=1 Tax=Skermanella cutis TaxID=2775420 RepID=A0ABX7BHB7_9PROT|nr:hypothetical protein [Skermanella sp. TT6]QQP92985.1 hypothetical protein IGS68_27810 [Skermanella sp. TT6]